MCCSVNGSICLVCCVIDSVCESFVETIRKQCLGVLAILLLNVMEVLVWMEVLCWIDHVWPSK